MKLLAVGDMHLARLPAALPEALAEQARALGPETAWQRCVQTAIDQKVEAVLLAGDVVEGSRDFFTGYTPLKNGVEQLINANIQVIAVAGNHDTEVLPRLADAVPDLILLGRDGQWQIHELSSALILGWSFPQTRVHDSPLTTLPGLPDHMPVIGLLHCDLDQTGSHYAPVTSAELNAAPVAAWLLGHIHKPSLSNAERPIGYLGSVSALRASETGVRGPWLIDIADGQIHTEHIGLAPLAYESVMLDATELNNADELDSLLLESIVQLTELRGTARAMPEALGLRVSVTGQTDFGTALQTKAEQYMLPLLLAQQPDCSFFLDKITINTEPVLDLTETAKQAGAIGLLARHLLLLEQPESDEAQALIEQGLVHLAEIDRKKGLQSLPPITRQQAVDWLKQAGRRALTQILEAADEAR